MVIFNERGEMLGHTDTRARMQLDTSVRWDWRNPLNILPALVLLAFTIALLGSLLQLI